MKNQETLMASAAKLIQQFVPGFFPPLMKVLYQPKGKGIAQYLVGIAQAVTGENSMSAVHKKLTHDSESLATFQKETLEYERRMYQEQKIDCQNARQRDRELQKQTGYNHRADLMVLTAGLGLLLCLIFLIFYRHALSQEVITLVSAIAGIFGSCLKDAYVFEFGTSHTSKNHDAAP